MASTWILLLQLTLSVHLANADLPAIFIFGDSTADVGTNNLLKDCLATANNPYYGIDYPYSKPTGRFSNGYNTADSVARLLGDFRESPPPFLSLVKHMYSFKSKILLGANFASGGAGIFKETGFKTFKNVTPLGHQIQQFATVRKNITEVLGQAKAESLLANSLYILSVGSNDFFDFIRYGSNLSAADFILNLQNAYAKHLEKLYKLGSRKFGIISVPPIGCVPAIRVLTGGSCMAQLNLLAQGFNSAVLALMENFSSASVGVKYSFGDVFQMTTNIIDNPRAYGFKNVRDACCGEGPFNGKDKCTIKSKLCLNRYHFLFWDWFHPTQRVSQLAAVTLVYGEGSEYVTPMNFSRLAAIDI